MTKHLVDIDDAVLRNAQTKLGTATIKETVNSALQLASGERRMTVKKRLDVLARANLRLREEAWRSVT